MLLLGGPAAANPDLGATADLTRLAPEARATEAARLAALGARSVRMFLDWNEVEPTRGSFQWSQFEAAVAAARAQGLELLLVLGPTARWSVDPALGLSPELQPFSVPRSLTPWEAYTRAAAARFSESVDLWQVREQPNGANFRGAVWPEYARLLQSAAHVVRAVDAGAKVVLPEALPLDVSGMNRWLHTPEAASWDVYGAYLPAQVDLPKSALRLAVMAEINPPGVASSRPVWVVGASAPLPAEAWLEYYLLSAAFGVSRVYLPADLLGTVGAPQLAAMQYRGFLRLSPTVWALVFDDAAGRVVAAWSTVPVTLPAAALAPVADAAQVAQASYLGGAPGSAAQAGDTLLLRLGPRPALIRGLDTAFMQAGTPTRAHALAARGLPDLSALSAVSLDLGRAQPELGLYHQKLRGLPGGVSRVEGRSGRRALGTALNKLDQSKDSPWLYFDVDDSWLYFARGETKVAITVECQEAAAPRTTGFVIRYDSTTGTRSTNWQWVDVGTGWHRYTIVIDDADFTGRPGYDFALDAEAGRQDLWVASVTVEKLVEEASQEGRSRE